MNNSARPRRVNDLDEMHKFYEEVVGLEVLRRDEDFVFFKVAEVYSGHTQNLALFDASNTMFLDNKAVQLNQRETTLHHMALNIALEDFESEKMRLEGLGLKVNATVHERHFVFARCTSPTQKGICWSLSVTMQAWDRGNAGMHSMSALTSSACFGVKSRQVVQRVANDGVKAMTLDEKIHQYTQKLPHSFQEELLDFVQYLLMKAEQQEKRDWASLSLSSAMREIEDEPVLYSLSDVRVVF